MSSIDRRNDPRVNACVPMRFRVLDNPEMSVAIEDIQAGTLIFVGVAFIANPRQAGGIKSDILRDILARLREAGIAMVKPQEIAYRTIGDPAQPATPFES